MDHTDLVTRLISINLLEDLPAPTKRFTSFCIDYHDLFLLSWGPPYGLLLKNSHKKYDVPLCSCEAVSVKKRKFLEVKFWVNRYKCLQSY